MTLLLFTSGLGRPGLACTTAIISGSATADGRPILWKNRDIDTPRNEVIHVTDGKYAVTALANGGGRTSVWMGVNAAGLCVENTLCKDLAYPKDVKGPDNGAFILDLLKACATVEEVRAMMVETDRTGRSTNATFGVIDANGGAVLFEASHNTHVMYDANDKATAPQGIIVRSNFSLVGQKLDAVPSQDKLSALYSGERYRRAADVLLPLAGKVDVKTLLRNCARDLANDRCEAHVGSVNGPAGALPEFIPTKSTVSRTTTVSFAVFHGVRSGEDPLLTTMWLGLGDPKFSVAVPCWVATESVASELRGSKGAPLCLAAIALREQFYDKDRDGVHTDGLSEVWQQLWPLEDELLVRVDGKLEQWRKSGIDRRSMAAIHQSAAEQALAHLKELVKTRTPVEATAGSGDSR